MTERDENRRYSDEEFGLILRKAIELEARSAPGLTARGGLSIDDLRAIAAEVGLDPARITQAAAMLPAVRGGRLSRVLGGPESLTYDIRVDGELADDDRAAILQLIRRVLNQHGEAKTVGGVLEWKSVGRVNQIYVTLTSRSGSTDVRVLVERSGALVLSSFFPLVGWMVLAGAIGGATNPTGGAAIAALLGGAATGAFVTARAIWSAGTARLRDTLERLTGALRQEVAILANPEPADPAAGGEPANDG